MKHPAEVVELNEQELAAVLERARRQPLSEPDYQKLKSLIETLSYLTRMIERGRMSLRRMRQMLFGAKTEKTQKILPPGQTPTAAVSGSPVPNSTPSEQTSAEAGGQRKAKGHGRNGAAQYTGGKRIEIPHPSLKAGQGCPECLKGKLYSSMEPGRLVRLIGQAPIGATVWELEKLRCNLCGEVYTAEAPAEVGPEKYDATSAAMIAMLKYGSGMPFNRLQGLQGNLGIPLPASTQWEIVAETADKIVPVFDELVQQAAQGEVLYNDDTTVKILAMMKERVEQETAGNDQERTGMFTSGIVSVQEGRRIALFFSGHRHAGENLTEVLQHRAAGLVPPIQMCDALLRNLPKEFTVVLANCMAHARRKFVEVAPAFPGECRYVLETLKTIYNNDEVAGTQKMTAAERLLFHQTESGPVMEDLHQWLRDQIEQHLVEPNSTLGGAISYLKDHWKPLTLFLQTAGAPLDNNLCERALKKAILHRKNALFYKTRNGARVADLFMSLIYTCQLSGVNPFDYLTELQRHAEKLPDHPKSWMPWNYRETIQAAPSYESSA